VMEEVAGYFWRREGISSVTLRLPAVYEAGQADSEIWRTFAGDFGALFDAFATLPQAEQRARVARAIAKFDETRPERATYGPGADLFARWGALREDPDVDLLVSGFGHSNFWTSLDARDAAQALEKGLTADYQGSHPLFVNDSENAACIDSERLAHTFFPEVTARTHPLQGREPLVSIDQARALIGFEPEHHISEVLE
jgi:nucleoside-diphosphate-sugar epimerase